MLLSILQVTQKCRIEGLGEHRRFQARNTCKERRKIGATYSLDLFVVFWWYSDVVKAFLGHAILMEETTYEAYNSKSFVKLQEKAPKDFELWK